MAACRPLPASADELGFDEQLRADGDPVFILMAEINAALGPQLPDLSRLSKLVCVPSRAVCCKTNIAAARCSPRSQGSSVATAAASARSPCRSSSSAAINRPLAAGSLRRAARSAS